MVKELLIKVLYYFSFSYLCLLRLSTGATGASVVLTIGVVETVSCGATGATAFGAAAGAVFLSLSVLLIIGRKAILVYPLGSHCFDSQFFIKSKPYANIFCIAIIAYNRVVDYCIKVSIFYSTRIIPVSPIQEHKV